MFSVMKFSGSSCLCLHGLGTSSQVISTARSVLMEGGLGGCGGVYFLQNVCSGGDFFGVLLLTASFGACPMWRRRIWPLPQALTLAGCVHCVNAFFSIDTLDPKNVDSGIWMQPYVNDLVWEGVLILPAP